MADPNKPRSEAELPWPFDSIGEPGWAARAVRILNDYGAPVPTPIPSNEIAILEARLGLALPPAYCTLLRELGPLDCGWVALLAPSQVTFLTNYWAREGFSSRDAARLPTLLGIADYMGSGDFIALDVATGECLRCGHDPPGLSDALSCVDALVQIVFLNLPVGYYGWSDDALEALIEDFQLRRFGTRL